MNLRAKFGLAVALLVTLVVAGVGVMTVVSERRTLRSEMQQHHAQVAQRLAQVCEESLYQSELVVFNYLRTLRDERGFIGASCVDATGRIQIHSNPASIGGTLASPGEAAANEAKGIFRQVYPAEDGSVVDLSAPVLFGGRRWGTARLLLSQSALDQFLNQSAVTTLRRVAFISGIALLLGLAGAFYLAGTLVRPIHQVIGGMREVAKGRLEPISFSRRTDELGWVGKELNVMIDRLKELEEMKKDFVSGVTHELRSPLTAIDRYVSLLIKGTYGALSSRQADSLVTVQNNTKRLMRFIDDLLSTARLEARRVDLYCDHFDVMEAVREVASLYRPLSEEKALALVVERPGESCEVWADREKVIQILHNLLSNAFKFTTKGTVTIGAQRQGESVRVSVADTGTGIPDEARKKIFDKFFRVPETAHQAKGTGLGLSIAKGLVEAQGGSLGVESVPGKGATFWFLLPVDKPK